MGTYERLDLESKRIENKFLHHSTSMRKREAFGDGDVDASIAEADCEFRMNRMIRSMPVN